jgi:hypothetical protein
VLPTGGYERYEHALASQLSTYRAPYTQANRGVINRYVSTGAAGAVEDHWNYTPTSGKVSITAPDETLTERYMYMEVSGFCAWGYCPDTARAGKVYEERAYSAPQNGVRRLLRRTLSEWAMTGSNASGAPGATRNSRMTKEVSILLDADGEALARTTEYGYDLSNQFTTGPNQTSVSEYNYVPVDQNTAQTAAIGSIPRVPCRCARLKPSTSTTTPPTAPKTSSGCRRSSQSKTGPARSSRRRRSSTTRRATNSGTRTGPSPAGRPPQGRART